MSSPSGGSSAWITFWRTSRLLDPSNGLRPDEHFVEDGAEREDIAAGVEHVPRRLFGGHVGDGADDHPGLV